ncbi:MAG: hypothetical protein WDN08_16690 [Rhizomicrobium sp.]
MAIAPELFERRCVHVIDLSVVKTTSGPLWDEIGASIRSRLESILRTQLSPESYFERSSETRYVLVTPATRNDDGAIAALRVAGELETTLNGRCDLDRIHIEEAAYDGPCRIKSQRIWPEQLNLLAQRGQLFDTADPSQAGLGLAGRADRRRQTKRPSKRRSGLEIVHHFEPVWDAKNEVISTYLCTPESIESCDAPGEKIKFSDLTQSERATAELSCLKTGVGQLSRSLESGDRFLLGVPISFETLCTPNGRTEFSRTCRGLPAIYRPYIMFLLVDLPVGVTQSRMTDLAMIIRPFGNVIASVAGGCRNFSAYDGNGFCALAFDPSKESGGADLTRARIRRVGLAGQANRLGPMILNVMDPQTLAIAIGAEFQMLHGPAIAAPVAAPRRMTRLQVGSVVPALARERREEWF